MSKQDTPHPPKRERERTPNNRTTTGFRLSDALWAVLQPLLPEHVNRHRFGGGRPRVPDRTCADAIFYVLRTGCQWQALDQTELCAHSTAHDRFQAWVEAGVFLQLWQARVQRFAELRGIEWDWLAMDGALTKAPLGGEKTVAVIQAPKMRVGSRQRQEEAYGVWAAGKASRAPRGAGGA